MTLIERLEAPFTPEQVHNLNEYQRTGMMHPFTCQDSAHGPLIARMSEIARVMRGDYDGEFDNWAKWIDKSATRLETLTAENERLREALGFIAEEHDAGRHDGLPEPCPALEADVMWSIARGALKQGEQ